jgi:hypothetical protein
VFAFPLLQYALPPPVATTVSVTARVCSKASSANGANRLQYGTCVRWKGLNATTSGKNSRRLDSDATFLLILPRICEARFSCLSAGNNSSHGHQGVSQCRLSMINVSYHGHIPDISLFVHHNTDLIYSEVHLEVEYTAM